MQGLICHAFKKQRSKPNYSLKICKPSCLGNCFVSRSNLWKHKVFFIQFNQKLTGRMINRYVILVCNYRSPEGRMKAENRDHVHLRLRGSSFFTMTSNNQGIFEFVIYCYPMAWLRYKPFLSCYTDCNEGWCRNWMTHMLRVKHENILSADENTNTKK